jgi:hypothetical protein
LFRLPLPILTIAPILAVIFSIPQATTAAITANLEGETDTLPIVLPLPSSTTVVNFRAYIFFLVPWYEHDIVWDMNAWFGVLRISSWVMHDFARTRVIEQLDPHVRTWPSVQLYMLAREHRVLEWHIHAFRRLLCRPESLDVEEIDGLGSAMTLKIQTIRLQGERTLTMRIHDQFMRQFHQLAENLWRERPATPLPEFIVELSRNIRDAEQRYRTALPAVAMANGREWAKAPSDEFVLRHFPAEFL